MKIAEERAVRKHEIQMQNHTEEQKTSILKEREQTEKEGAFYNIAIQLARCRINFFMVIFSVDFFAFVTKDDRIRMFIIIIIIIK